ncbi:MAG: DinB family protein [Thermoanaerobaculia bacterium]
MSGAAWGEGASGPDERLRLHLVRVLDGRNAHVDFEGAVADLPAALRGRRPEGMPHSPWEVLEHLRIAQEEILEFSRRPDWTSPAWPEGCWPAGPKPPDDGAWDRSLDGFRSDLAAMKELVLDPEHDLYQPFPWGEGETLLREALLLADHNAYHLGELVAVRRMLGAWP